MSPKPAKSVIKSLLKWDPFDQAEAEDMVHECPGTPAEKATALWAAFAEESYAAGDPMSFDNEQRLRALYAASLLRDAPHAPTPEQLRYALRRLAKYPQSISLLHICSCWLAVSAPAIDEALKGELPPVLLEQFCKERFSRGAPDDRFFTRELFGASFAEQCRSWLVNRVDSVLIYQNFGPVRAVVPVGHPDSAKIVIGYWGPSWLKTTLGFIDERGLRDEVIELIDRHLQRVPPWPQPPRSLVDGWKAAALLGLCLRQQAGLPTSAALTEALARPPDNFGQYALDERQTDGAERAAMRAAAAHFGPAISAALTQHHAL